MPSTQAQAPTETWGDGVKALRLAAGLKQEQLAQLAGCNQVTISRIEHGSRQISDALRLRIAKALDVDPYTLFPYLDEGAA